ncbi:MAG: flagellar basal body-associated FliL family protein [Pseudomonadota bacterium]
MAKDDMDLEEVGQKKGRAKTLLIVVVVLIVILAGGALALKILAPGLVPFLGSKEAPPAGQGQGGQDQANTGVLYPLKPFIVNLADASGKRYLKMALTLELSGPDTQKEAENRMPQIQDAILILLSSQTFADISNIEGKMRLRSQIISACNRFLTQGKVANVYFSEFVVQ